MYNEDKFLNWYLKFQSIEHEKGTRPNVPDSIIKMCFENNWLYSGIAYRSIIKRSVEHFKLGDTLIQRKFSSWSKEEEISKELLLYHGKGVLLKGKIINSIDPEIAIKEMKIEKYFESRSDIALSEREVIVLEKTPGKIIMINREKSYLDIKGW